MADCNLGECKGDPTYKTPIPVNPYPGEGGGGGGASNSHKFVTALPAVTEAQKGVEYVVMDDLNDPATYKGTYSLNPVTNSFVATSGGGGGSTIVVDTALSTTSPNPVQNKVITTELNKKQDKLTPGEGITIDPSTNTISVSSTYVLVPATAQEVDTMLTNIFGA